VTVGEVPDIGYAMTSDGVHVAYQTVGEGPPDIVYANSFMSNIAVTWEYPRAVRFYERMASFGRLVLFDRRGTGLSDPITDHFTMDDRTSDIRAVMDAVGLERAVLLGSSEGGTACMYFAAMQPERVSALVLFSPFVLPIGSGLPGAWPRDVAELVIESIEQTWRTGVGFELINPSLAGDADALAWYVRYFRLSASPMLARSLMRHNAEIDIRELLPSIQVPTLVLQRRDETWISPEHARYAARTIADARLVEVPGTDHFIWEQNADALVEEIEEFVTGVRRSGRPERVLKTVLFTDIVGSTTAARELGDERWHALLDRHETVVARQVTRYDGQLVKTTGDGVLATFDGPARAIRCALAIREAVRGLGLEVRAGVHTGEVERRNGDIAGIGVHIAARVAAAAAANEVLVSRTVADLTAGSEVQLTDRGEHELHGIPERWRLFAANL
jgi:pimeloyl-ACP methyl ester carboxylesterase